MKNAHVIAALRFEHPWISEERLRDLLDEAKDVLGPYATPFECGQLVLAQMDVLYGPGTSTKAGRK